MEPDLTEHNACLFGFSLCATNMVLTSNQRCVFTVVKVVSKGRSYGPAVDIAFVPRYTVQLVAIGRFNCNSPQSGSWKWSREGEQVILA